MEFYNLLKMIDSRITYFEADQVFQALDVSKDGKLSYNEFKSIFINYDFSDLNDKAA